MDKTVGALYLLLLMRKARPMSVPMVSTIKYKHLKQSSLNAIVYKLDELSKFLTTFCFPDYEQKSLIDHENSSDSGNSSQKSYTALASLPTQNNFNSLSLSPPQAVATQLEALSVTGPKEIGDSMMPSDISTSLVTQPQESGESRHHEGYYETNLLKNSFPDRSGDREESLSDVTAAHEKAVMSCGAYKNLTAKDTFESTHVKSEPCC